MNKKLSLIILLILLCSLISVLLAFISFSKSGDSKDVGQLKTGYEQLAKQVNELKVTTEELETKVGSNNITLTQGKPTTENNSQTTQQPTSTPPTPIVTKSVASDKVNMRDSSSTSGKVVRQLSKGEVVTPTGKTTTSGGYVWTEIKDSKGNTGWVVSSFIK